MSRLISLIRPDLREFKSYSSARDEAKNGKIWMNANESPFPYLVKNNTLLNRYPQKQPSELRTMIASLYGVVENQMVLSRGSDEVIDLLIRLLCRAGIDSIMITPPTFGMYAVCARLQGANLIEIPLKNNFELDVDGIIKKWNASVKIIFLCSPNNPTGNLLRESDIRYLCENTRSLIVVDEAYIEFSDAASFSRLITEYDNIAILRTFSKAYGLAAARAGALLAQAELVDWIMKIIPPYPLPVSSTVIIEEVISKKLPEIKNQINYIKSERNRLINELRVLPCIKKVWDSEANFILVETINASLIMSQCAEAGIILRNMNDKLNLKNCVRISIGLAEENNELMRVLQNIGEL